MAAGSTAIELKDGRVLMLMRTGLGAQYQEFLERRRGNLERPGALGSGVPPRRCASPEPRGGHLLAVWNHNPDSTAATPSPGDLDGRRGHVDALSEYQRGPGGKLAYPAITWVDGNALLTYFSYAGNGLPLELKILPEAWFYE